MRLYTHLLGEHMKESNLKLWQLIMVIAVISGSMAFLNGYYKNEILEFFRSTVSNAPLRIFIPSLIIFTILLWIIAAGIPKSKWLLCYAISFSTWLLLIPYFYFWDYNPGVYAKLCAYIGVGTFMIIAYIEGKTPTTSQDSNTSSAQD